MKSRRMNILLLTAAGALLIAVVCLVLLLQAGVIWFNNPSKKEYPIQGIDVSSYQEKIDWKALQKQGLSFAFVKATEGSLYQDEFFSKNWYEAQEIGLTVGAYHFFSFESPGSTQAENFIQTTPKQPGMLPPVVDVELYGRFKQNPIPALTVKQNLDDMIRMLHAHYGVAPILYATQHAYRLYLQDDYEGYPIWIRGVFWKPSLSDGREWTFWQFSDHGKFGSLFPVDRNVFRGTAAELKSLCVPEFANEQPLPN